MIYQNLEKNDILVLQKISIFPFFVNYIAVSIGFRLKYNTIRNTIILKSTYSFVFSI